MPIAAPLAGLRILTVEQFGAAPYGSLMLADLGAEVIKIETPGVGDATRHSGPHFFGEADSPFFQTFNRNKRSLTLNLKAPEGQAILRKLAVTSDAVMNNLRGDQPGKLGLTYEALKEVNPKLVCGHISAYGRANSRSHRPGYDFLMQGEAGWMELTGAPENAPTRVGLSVVDFMTGMTLAIGLVSAILKARESGEGGEVDTSLFEVALHQTTYQGAWYLNFGDDVGRKSRSAHPSNVPVEVFPASDGWVWIMAMTQKFWLVLCEALERPDIAEDPRFAGMEDRRINREALQEVLDPIFRTRSIAEWEALLVGKVPVGPVLTLSRAMDNPFVGEIGMIEEYEHPSHGPFRLLGSPLSLDGRRATGAAERNKTGPALGGDSAELLEELGYSAEEIAALKAAGTI